jgi:hypothetical protein
MSDVRIEYIIIDDPYDGTQPVSVKWWDELLPPLQEYGPVVVIWARSYDGETAVVT